MGAVMNDDPIARALALVERLFALLHDCRRVVRELEPGKQHQQPPSAEAERLVYYALAGAIEEGPSRPPSTS